MFTDTIFALSSGRLPAGVAVIRLSGPQAGNALAALGVALPPPRALAYATLRSATGEVIDRGLVVYLPAPATFTGEDSVELHVHGSKAVVAALLAELGAMPGLRQAEPGEFTRRAHFMGKLDLPRAEALADLLSAETEAQRRFAVANASGARTAVYQSWRERLIHARAMIEAELDFSDEDDVPGSVAAVVWHDMNALRAEIERHIEGYRRSEIIRDGFRVAIVGAPNAGKSSLLNILAGRDAAIVSDEPGTTRDLLEVSLDLDGAKVLVTDTAGIREADSPVEQEGIRRAHRAAEAADLVLLLADLTDLIPQGVLAPELEAVLVGTKLDLVPSDNQRLMGVRCQFEISTVTGEGVDALVAFIAANAVKAQAGISDSIPFTARQRDELRTAATLLARAVDPADIGLELRAEELRRATNALGRVVGAVGVEDVLDAVFSRFCIGK